MLTSITGVHALATSRTKRYVCRCGTGYYCRRHLAYRLRASYHSVAIHYSMLTEHEVMNQQPCGGGHRVIRKKIGGV